MSQKPTFYKTLLTLLACACLFFIASRPAVHNNRWLYAFILTSLCLLISWANRHQLFPQWLKRFCLYSLLFLFLAFIQTLTNHYWQLYLIDAPWLAASLFIIYLGHTYYVWSKTSRR